MKEKNNEISKLKKYLCKVKNGNEITPNQNINSDDLWVVGLIISVFIYLFY